MFLPLPRLRHHAGGAIAGIVVGVAVAVAALLAAGFFALRFSQRALRGEGRVAAMGKAASFKRCEPAA